MRLVICFFVCTLLINKLSGQSLFNKLLQTNALDNQSRLYDLYSDSKNFQVLGDWIDTIIDPNLPTTRPWIGEMDYDGNILYQNSIIIPELNGFISTFTCKLLKIRGDKLLFSTMYFDDSDVAHTLLLKVNSRDGSVLQYKVLNNQVNINEKMLPGWFEFINGDSNRIASVSSISEGVKDRNVVYIIDTLFNILDTILIDYNGRDNFIYYLEKDNDSNFVAIGDSWDRNQPGYFPDVRLFYMKFNISGEVLKFRTYSEGPNSLITMSTSDSYTIIKKNDGGWIIPAVNATIIAQCSGCLYSLPYVYSFDSTLEQLLWRKHFSDDIDDHNQVTTLYATAPAANNREYLTIGIDINQSVHDSYIFKYSEVGDSLWKRHYLPLNWNSDSVLWAIFKYIRETPDGNYVAVGHASDSKSGMWRSWVMQIDSFGCLVPGCQTTSPEYISENNSKPFSFYPNPAKDQLFIDLKTELRDRITLTICDMNGVQVNHLDFIPNIYDQYIIPLDSFVPGSFIMRVTDVNNNLIQVEKIIIIK